MRFTSFVFLLNKKSYHKVPVVVWLWQLVHPDLRSAVSFSATRWRHPHIFGWVQPENV